MTTRDAFNKFLNSLTDYERIAYLSDWRMREHKFLAQVALEALRVVYLNQERCQECGLGPVGALMDSLKDAFGPEPWNLIYGIDGNVDKERFDDALRQQAEKEIEY
jgi:hypothetical protein